MQEVGMLGVAENAKIGGTQYLCYGNECLYICRPITATFRKSYCQMTLICIT